ncbi:Ig-like domain-containing protein [Bifidobacterium gallicum]|uniref:Putative S-layer y domain protein n=2 Tax=Bifidobacterium gallicum DSM 20093 = LMG 11596 TaxID=561180 RepID=A0A087AJY6_9BIFI|nr:Ig-like domain-containing protein [Bifidobacterium gallicum]KFI59086.1 putative S-layer y domain protein [Bifidobacterium gallicum DSM 20093 = LMG 11596]
MREKGTTVSHTVTNRAQGVEGTEPSVAMTGSRNTNRGAAKKATALVLSMATLLGGLSLGVSTAQAAIPTTSYDRTLGNATFEAARQQNGLAKEMSYGSILHAWMWSANTLKSKMAEIADAGYTTIQTVPIAEIKGPVRGMQFDENWYFVYQPTGTKIGNKVIGTEAEIQAMTAEAHKYGIRVIADGVINHFSSDWNAIDPEWQDKNLFHTRNGICGGADGDKINYGERWQVTQCHLLGLWDLNTQSQEVSNRMHDYLSRAVADGIDGFRYDAAKHIELPNEFATYSPYYDTILPNGAQYQYGEVLQGDSGLNAAAYPALFDKYSTNGGGNTASKFGGTIRAAINSGRVSASSMRNLQGDGVRDNQLVTWVESHDNYANKEMDGHGVSSAISAEKIRKGWALIASRAGGAPLFFNRPVGSGGPSQPQFSERTQLGSAGDDEWKHPEVKWVNKFRNAMEGSPENLQNCNGDQSCVTIERGIADGNSGSDGLVAVNLGGGDKDLAGMSTILDDGTYKDQVNGGSITVSGGKITSGRAAGNKVSVFWNNEGGSNIGAESISAAPMNTTFTGNGIEVTLRAQNATDLKWTTSDGKSGTFASGEKITVGASAQVGDTITLTITGKGTGAEGKSLKQTYTYTKTERSSQNLAKYYTTNTTGQKIKKTISVDGAAGDWDSSMLIAQGTANDDPRIYRENSMYEMPIDLYALYGTYDDNNLYLMWEMTNVQDVVDQMDNYPIGRPAHVEKGPAIWIALDTGRPDNRVGKNANLQTGGTIWDSRISWEQNVNNVIGLAVKKGENGPWVYGGDETGLSATALYGPGADPKSGTQKSNIQYAAGTGLLSKSVMGLEGGWGHYNNRLPGDMKNDNGPWVDFMSKGHNPSTQDSICEIAIPLEELGISAADVEKTGVGVQVVATMGLSGMDSLPYDLTVNDNADLPDTQSQENNSYEKSDEDSFSVPMARIGNAGGEVEIIPVDSVTIAGGDISIDLGTSRTAQVSATVSPANATSKKVTWASSNEAVAKIDKNGKITASKAGTTTITATAGGKSASIKVTVTGELVIPTTTTVYYPSATYGANSTYLHYRVNKNGAAGTWTTVPGVKMEAACDGWVKYTVDNPNQDEVEFVINNGAGAWDNNGEANYKGTGESLKLQNGTLTVDSAPCVVDVPVSSVSIAGGDFSLAVDATKQLSASVAPSNATDKVVSWKSSDAAVATVDASGKVMAKKAGSATITASAGGKSSSVTVTVVSALVPVSSVTISPSSLSLKKGESGQLTATVAPSNASDKTVTWRSSNPAVVSVDADGKVTALKAGVAAVTATAGGVASSAIAVSVTETTVVPVTGVQVSDPADGKLELTVGASHQVKASVTPSNATDQTVSYSSTNASVVSVSSTGVVTAKTEGTANIIVSASGHAALVSVKVTPRKVQFTDVPVSAWQASDIQWLADNAISMGNGDGTFGFGKSLNRRDMAIFLYRLAKLNGDASAASFKPSAADYARFSDVKQGSFGATEVLWLASKGVIKGFEDGSFRGDKSLNRQDSAIYLYRFAKVMGDASASSFKPSAADYARFSDVKQGSFGATEILWLTSVGIVKGNTDGTFRGGSNLTREDMAVFLHRTHNHLNK